LKVRLGTWCAMRSKLNQAHGNQYVNQCLIRAPYIYCILSVLLGVGCTPSKQPLDGHWQVSKSATLATYHSRQGAFNVLPEKDPGWDHFSNTCFVIREHAQLQTITATGTKASTIRIAEIEPDLWKVSVDYAGYPFNIRAAQVGEELRILDAGYLFILENSCPSKP
jgi:hypothetical protein